MGVDRNPQIDKPPLTEAPKENAFQHLIKELGISDEDLKNARDERRELKETYGIIFGASQIDNWYLYGVWKAFEHGADERYPRLEKLPMTKIDPISWLYPFLPKDVRDFAPGEIRHVFSQEVVKYFEENSEECKAALLPYAKQIVLSLMTEDSVFELHPETDLGGKNSEANIDAWNHFINLFRYLASQKSGEESKPFSLRETPATESPFHESAHCTFAVIKDEAHRQDFLDRLVEIAKAGGETLDYTIILAAEAFWDAERGFEKDGIHYMNFEMFFMSGYLDPVVRNEIHKKVVAWINGKSGLLPPTEEQIAETETAWAEKLTKLSKTYAYNLHLEQISWMRERYGVKEFTLHAGPLGGAINKSEFQNFKDNLKKLFIDLRDQNKTDVILQIESQGLTKSQWEDLLEDPELKNLWGKRLGITLDLVHVEAENNKFKAIQELKAKGDEDSLNRANVLDPLGTYEEKPSLEFFLNLILDHYVREVHISKTTASSIDWFKEKKTFVADDHLPISDNTKDTYVPGLAQTVKAVSKFNLEHRRDPDFHPIVIMQESTFSQDDIRELSRICKEQII